MRDRFGAVLEVGLSTTSCRAPCADRVINRKRRLSGCVGKLFSAVQSALCGDEVVAASVAAAAAGQMWA